jgi:hypothetical protein
MKMTPHDKSSLGKLHMNPISLSTPTVDLLKSTFTCIPLVYVPDMRAHLCKIKGTERQVYIDLHTTLKLTEKAEDFEGYDIEIGKEHVCSLALPHMYVAHGVTRTKS